MTIIPHVDHDPNAMTTRARVYIQAAGQRHFWIGMFLLVTPWLFGSAAFIPIFNLIPLVAWGVIMVFTGVVCIIAAFFRNKDWARFGMVISAVVTLVLAAGLAIGIVSVWVTWVDALGWESIFTLLAQHPADLPSDILLLAPPPPSPFLPIIMLALTVKDFAVCAQPLRVPLEDQGIRRVRTA